MTTTLLAELIQKQTAESIVSVLNRSIDRWAEEMAHDLLRDPDFRAEMQELLRAAFRQALKDLNEPVP